MNKAARAGLSALAALVAAGASAQAPGPVKELPAVQIHRKTNPGDLPCKGFFALQNDVRGLPPPGRHAVELRLRVNIAGRKGPAYDEYQPRTWAVAIVGGTLGIVTLHETGM